MRRLSAALLMFASALSIPAGASSPSQHKSFSDLVDLYQDADNDQDRLIALWAVFNADHPETADFFRGLLFSGEPDWLLAPAVAWLGSHPDELPRVEDLARLYLGQPPGERGRVLNLMLEAAEEKDGPLLWSLLQASDRSEVRVLVHRVLGWPAVAERLSVPADERVKIDLLAIGLEASTSAEIKHRLKVLLRKVQDPRWRKVENLEDLARALETSKDRAERWDVLLEIFDRAGSADLPALWRPLRQAKDWEMDLLVEWAASRSSPELLASLYRGARSDPEKDRVLCLAGAATKFGQLGHVLAELGAFGQGASRLGPLARAFLTCPNSNARENILGELDESLATAQDLPVMLEILRGTTPREGMLAARWFALHPSPEALPLLKRLPVGAVLTEGWMTQALAAAGDPEILDLALRARPNNENDVWAIAIVANSPLPAATGEARRILAEGGDPLDSLLRSLFVEDNASPWREWFLDEVLRSGTEYARERALDYLRRR